MFVPFKRPEVGQHIRLSINITNQRGTFKAPHNFKCVYASDETCELLDIDGNRVFGVLCVDIRDHFEVISEEHFRNRVQP